MRKIISLATVALFVIGFAAPDAAAQATTFKTNIQVPVDEIVPFVTIPCAGEDVALSGTLHILIRGTIDDNGGVHSKFHFQPQGVKGLGLTTGDKYQATGVTQETINATGLPFTRTFVNNFRIIGPGPGNNFLAHDTVHLTINANGTATAVVANSSAECK